jgi:AraC-like DNA-binding protein
MGDTPEETRISFVGLECHPDQMYTERASSLPGAVVWTTVAGSVTAVVPDGCMDVIWFGDRLLVAGPDTRPHLDNPDIEAVGSRLVGVRFAPGMGPSVLGVPADELRDGRVWLDDLWGRSTADRWRDHVATAGPRGRMIEALAAERLEASPVEGEITHVARASRRGDRVDAIAADLGWSERTLRRRCDAAFGYGPKVLARILRFQRAARLVRSGHRLSDAAAVCGYADQSHLSRETRRLTGHSLSTLR